MLSGNAPWTAPGTQPSPPHSPPPGTQANPGASNPDDASPTDRQPPDEQQLPEDQKDQQVPEQQPPAAEQPPPGGAIRWQSRQECAMSAITSEKFSYQASADFMACPAVAVARGRFRTC